MDIEILEKVSRILQGDGEREEFRQLRLERLQLLV